MKIKEIILEYKRDITASKLGEKLYTRYISEPASWLVINIGIVDKAAVIDDILSRIEAADPTNNKQYVMWIIRVYLNTNIHLEDAITKPTRALAKYYKLTRAKKIQPPYNDINRIKDINQLEQIVSQFPDEEKQLVDKGKAQEIYRDNEIRVIVPLDETAACYYGQGTKWCTAASTNNMFDNYTRGGSKKLYIILPQNPTYPGEKYQISFEFSQFMNELDEPVNLVKIFNKYPSLRKAFKTILFGDTYEFLVYKNPTDELLVRAVSKDANFIQYIKNPSETVQLAAVTQHVDAIQFIKNPSEAVQLAVVQQNGHAIEYIKRPSEAVQIAAVKQDGYAIIHIKNPSEAVQIAAVEQYGYAIIHIKNPSEKVQLVAIKRYPNNIQYIKNPTESVQIESIINRADNIVYIKNPTEKAQLEAVKQVGYLIKYIKTPSEAVQLAAVKNDIDVFEYIKNPSQKVVDYYEKNK